jgi:hypothetical protein
MHLMHSGGSMYVVPVGKEMAQADEDWLNNTMFIVWRIQAEKVEAAREAFMDGHQKVFAVEHGADPNVLPRDWPEAILKLWHTKLDELMALPEYRRPLGNQASPLPPNLPRTLAAWLPDYSTENLTWRAVDHDEVANMVVPEDPVLTRHKAYWDKVFETVGEKVGTTIPAPCRAAVENQYSSRSTRNQPWYEFSWYGHKVMVGPRKRVDVIDVYDPTPSAQAFANRVGAKDNVTYWGDTSHAGLHAWTQEKLVEYMVGMLKALEPGA